jgi:hypothetical protein
MKTYCTRGIRVGLVLPLFAAIALVLAGIQLAAAADQDADGLDDAVEQHGCIANQLQPPPTVPFPMPVGPEVQKFFPNCPGYNATSSVNTTVKDVFVILLAKQDPMDLSVVTPAIKPDDWLDFVANINPGRMKVHRVMRDPSTYCKCVLAPANQSSCSDADCTQKAIRIHEDNSSTLSDTSNVLGITPWQGNPNTAGDILIYTECIAEDILTTCAGKKCVFTDENGFTHTATSTSELGYLYRNMKKSVIGHESGHTMMLRAVCPTDLGCHYPQKTGWLMDASVFRKRSGKTVTWYIPYQHSTEDVPKLK